MPDCSLMRNPAKIRAERPNDMNTVGKGQYMRVAIIGAGGVGGYQAHRLCGPGTDIPDAAANILGLIRGAGHSEAGE